MKKNILIVAILLMVPVFFIAGPVSAQEKTQAEKEKEKQLQEELLKQKKELTEQQRKASELERAIFEAQRETGRNRDEINTYIRSALDRSVPYIVTPDVNVQLGQFYGRGGDSERTTWDFSKNVRESTFSRQYSFDVEKTAGNVVMSVNGDCRSGEIRIKILMPGGKTYSDIVIDEFGNLNWRKSFTISEEENKDKAGEWVFKIDASKATGFFKISLQTY